VSSGGCEERWGVKWREWREGCRVEEGCLKWKEGCKVERGCVKWREGVRREGRKVERSGGRPRV
jgi:hypothetical protein